MKYFRQVDGDKNPNDVDIDLQNTLEIELNASLT